MLGAGLRLWLGARTPPRPSRCLPPTRTPLCCPDCRHGGFQPLPPDLVRSYRQRMAACLGFSAAAHAPAPPERRPRILLVDRRYAAGRHIINVHEVHAALAQRYGAAAEVQLEYMEGLPLAQQARLWNSASVAVHMHGASLGNWPFLPHGAAVVHVSWVGPGRSALQRGVAFGARRGTLMHAAALLADDPPTAGVRAPRRR